MVGFALPAVGTVAPLSGPEVSLANAGVTAASAPAATDLVRNSRREVFMLGVRNQE